MLASFLSTVLLGVQLASAVPILPRLTTLDPAAVAEAQPRDDTATRALSAVAIKTGSGQCLNVVRLASGCLGAFHFLTLLPSAARVTSVTT
jgi:hypothetical protein